MNSLALWHTGQGWAWNGTVGAVYLGPRGRGAIAGAVESGDPLSPPPTEADTGGWKSSPGMHVCANNRTPSDDR